MSFPKKDKVGCRCRQCGEVKHVFPYKAKTFKFCSDQCKWAAKKKQVPVNKLQPRQKIIAQCQNPLCQTVRFILPSDSKLGRYKYCSKFCRNYVRSDKFKEEIEKLKELDQQQKKKNIWFL